MCLNLDSNWKKRTRKYKKFLWVFPRRKPIKGYKLLRVLPDGKITSLMYHSHYWNSGLNVSDRSDAKTTYADEYVQSINKGFHFFLDLEEAERFRKRYYQAFIVKTDLPQFVPFEFEIYPKDIVAVGNDREFVATRCRMIGATECAI